MKTKIKNVIGSLARRVVKSKNVVVNFDELSLSARRKPFAKVVVKPYFARFKKINAPSVEEEIQFNQLQFIHSSKKWECLNSLGTNLHNRGKDYQAAMCFAESLRLNPSNDETYKMLMKTLDSTKRVYPISLEEDSCMFSVVMGTYNKTYEIKESIQSVLDQTCQDFELIIVNDGGSDEVKEIVDSFHSSKIRYFKLDHNRGLCAAFNFAIQKAKGCYIAYLDDDDVYYPDHLESFKEIFDQTGCPIAYSNTKGIWGRQRGEHFDPERMAFLWDKEYSKEEMIRNIYIGNLSLIHKKSVLEKTGLYREGLEMALDQDMLLRMASHYDFYHLSRVTGEYRQRISNSVNSNYLSACFYGEMVQLYYAFFNGNLALLKYFLVKNQKAKAQEYYDKIRNAYAGHFKIKFILEELITIADKLGDKAFSKCLKDDYQIVKNIDIQKISTKKNK